MLGLPLGLEGEDMVGECKSCEDIVEIKKMLDDIHPVILESVPQMYTLMTSVATAQHAMASAATSMATTNAKAEARYEKLEERLQEANERAAGKGQVPLMSHYLTVAVVSLIAILTVLYGNRQALEATPTSVKINPVGK